MNTATTPTPDRKIVSPARQLVNEVVQAGFDYRAIHCSGDYDGMLKASVRYHNAEAAILDALALAAQPAIAAPVLRGSDVDFASIIADIGAIDTRHRGDPSYECDPRLIRGRACDVVQRHAEIYAKPLAAQPPTPAASPETEIPVSGLGWSVRERRNTDGSVKDCFVSAPIANGMAYGLEVLGDDYTGYGDQEQKLMHCHMIVAWANAQVMQPVVLNDAERQSWELHVAQAEAIRELLDLHAPKTQGNLQTRIAALLVQPVQPTPLTDAEIPHLGAGGKKRYDVDLDMWVAESCRQDEFNFARAIEAAHGISAPVVPTLSQTPVAKDAA